MKMWTHWSEDEIRQLRQLAKKGLPISEMSAILNRTEKAIKTQIDKRDIEWNIAYRSWTENDIKMLKEYWEEPDLSINAISKKMHRSIESIRKKATLLKLGHRPFDSEFLTTADISYEMGVSIFIVRRWVEKGLKARISRSGTTGYLISTDALLNFLETNPDCYNASKISEYLFLDEPDWLREKRKVDKDSYKNRKYMRWTEDEINLLVKRFKAGYSNEYIAKEIGKSIEAILRKLHNLGYTRNRWNDYEIEILRANYLKKSSAEVAKMLPLRSERAIYQKYVKLVKEKGEES